MNIVFVCTGNTCRSPMAEIIFNNECLRRGAEHKAASRGINVFFSAPINSKAVDALKKLGIDASSAMSKQIDEDDIKNADFILTMTSEHKMILKNAYKKYSSKIYTLCEKAYGRDKSIADPFGMDADVYFECACELKCAIDELIDKL